MSYKPQVAMDVSHELARMRQLVDDGEQLYRELGSIQDGLRDLLARLCALNFTGYDDDHYSNSLEGALRLSKTLIVAMRSGVYLERVAYQDELREMEGEGSLVARYARTVADLVDDAERFGDAHIIFTIYYDPDRRVFGAVPADQDVPPGTQAVDTFSTDKWMHRANPLDVDSQMVYDTILSKWRQMVDHDSVLYTLLDSEGKHVTP